ncbi:MAG: hypothetical protein ACTSU6_02155 [Candidatus Njordarchaeales archaeon]
MSKRTAVILSDDVYDILVKESLSRYGTTRAISKVLNELVREAIKLRGILEIKELLRKEKKIKITAEEFHKFRRELSKRLEE